MTLIVLAVIAVIALVARALGAAPVYPDEFESASYVYTATIEDTLLGWIQSVLDYVQDPDSFIFGITEPIGNFLVQYALEPLRVLLVELPWFVTVAGLGAIAFLASGLRPAVTVALMLLAIGIMGVWEPAMDTASQVLVATALAVAIGIAVGVWAAESPRVERMLRPLLDTLQTLPQLVYIIPFIYLMPVSRVPGVVASVLYAVPGDHPARDVGRAQRLTDAVEAAAAFGATRGQLLTEGQDPAGARRDHARRQPGDHHGARGRGDRRAGGVWSARRLGRARAAAQRVRAGRRGVPGHPRAGHRARPRDAEQGEKGSRSITMRGTAHGVPEGARQPCRARARRGHDGRGVRGEEGRRDAV